MNRTKREVPAIAQLLKKSALTLTAAAVLGALIPGAGTLPAAKAAALNEALKPTLPYNSLLAAASGAAGNAAAANLSVTHDGVTLKLSDLLYDGTRLTFILDREGVDLPGTVAPLSEREKPEDQIPKGYIKGAEAGGMTLLVDGKKMSNEYIHTAVFGDFPERENAYIAELQFSKPVWGNKFELTIQVQVTGVDEAFEFKVPVEIDKKSIQVKPNATKKHKGFSYTVKELYISSFTTRLVIDSTGKVPATSKQTGKYTASMMYYDIVDDQGKLLQQRKFPYYNSLPKTKYHIDELYSPVKGTPKYVTIKPFTLTVDKNDWSVVGNTEKSVGTKTYWKELEMKIPLDKIKK